MALITDYAIYVINPGPFRVPYFNGLENLKGYSVMID